MVELLKQPQFSPMSVGEQVITIFIGSKGLLDDIPVNAVSEFATGFLRWLKKEQPDCIEQINTSKDFSDTVVEKVTAAVAQYKATKS
jgi:F-type H+-transporting ATPase subunit alpha